MPHNIPDWTRWRFDDRIGIVFFFNIYVLHWSPWCKRALCTSEVLFVCCFYCYSCMCLCVYFFLGIIATQWCGTWERSPGESRHWGVANCHHDFVFIGWSTAGQSIEVETVACTSLYAHVANGKWALCSCYYCNLQCAMYTMHIELYYRVGVMSFATDWYENIFDIWQTFSFIVFTTNLQKTTIIEIFNIYIFYFMKDRAWKRQTLFRFIKCI